MFVFREYKIVFLVLFLALFVSAFLYYASFALVPKAFYLEKFSAYECGFDPFSSTGGRFDVRFYLVAILFIVFDLEVALFFPWSLIFTQLGLFGFGTMIFFLLLLTLGFIYEWQRGALDW